MGAGRGVVQGRVSSTQSSVEFPLRLLRTTRPRALAADDITTLRAIERTDWFSSALQLGRRNDELLAARAISLGAIATHTFGNASAITCHPGAEVVSYARHVADGLESTTRPVVDGLITTLRYVPEIFDWSRLPSSIKTVRVMELIDTLFELGPLAFVGPADSRIPPHLRQADGAVTLVGPGYHCRSNVVIENAMDLAGAHFLYTLALADRIPVVRPAAGCFVIRNVGSDEAGSRYTAYAQATPTVLALHQLAESDRSRPTLTVLRSGSLHVDHLRPILDSLGFGLEIAHDASPQPRAVLAA
jgi:hypothetical protein